MASYIRPTGFPLRSASGPARVRGGGEGASDRTARHEQVAQREHRGVGGQGEERAVAGAQGAVQAGSELGLDGDAVDRDAGVLQPQRHLRRARAAARRAAHVRGQDLEVGIPHPADVAPVGDVVVEHGEDIVLAVLQREGAQDLVGAGRVLDQQDGHVAIGDAQRLGAPEGGGDGVQPGVDVVEGRPEGERESGGAEGVVDVVEAGQGERDRPRPGRRAQREARAAHSLEHDVVGRDLRVGTRRAAAVAVVAPQVAHVDGVVAVGRAAAPAVLGVGGVLHLRQGHGVVLHPEVRGADVAPQVGDGRVVGVEDERRRGVRDDGRPAIGDRVELAVAVELVAEQVGQQQRARLELVDDLPEPELVDLEEAGVAVGRAVHEGGRHAAGHVRPGPVVHEMRAGALEDAGDHRRGRGLAVGGRDHGAAALEPRAQACDGVGLEAHEELARQRGAAAAGAARQRAGGPRGRHLDREGAQGSST